MVVFIASLLAATPVHVEKLGFSVVVRDGEVVVTGVAPGGPADQGKLKVGDVLTRLMSPQWFFGRGPLAELSETDLHDVLTAPAREPLELMVKHADGGGGVVQLQREEPAADPRGEFAQPLSTEQQQRLSARQPAQYTAVQVQRAQAEAQDRRANQPLVGSRTPSAVTRGTESRARPEATARRSAAQTA